MSINDTYKKIKRKLNPPTTNEGWWESLTEAEKNQYPSREAFIEWGIMMEKIMDSPYFTAEGAYQAFGIKGKIICGFPGVGKSTLFKELKDSKYKVLDSDSSTFDKKDFPANYINHIKEKTAEGYTILASSHKEVRDALIKEGILFTLVYPDKSLKDEYLKRYEERGSPKSFIELLDKNWDSWIGQCDDLDDKHVSKVKLDAGEFINAKKAGIQIPHSEQVKESLEKKPVLSQQKMVDDFENLIKNKDDRLKVFYKSGTFHARKGKLGEHIVTTIDGEDETQKTVGDNEVVIKGPAGELYVVSNAKFKERYDVDKELTDDFQDYKSRGLIRAYEHVSISFKFIASWDEEMICHLGDYLATPIKDEGDTSVPEVYRIERGVFDKTYSKTKGYP